MIATTIVTIAIMIATTEAKVVLLIVVIAIVAVMTPVIPVVGKEERFC